MATVLGCSGHGPSSPAPTPSKWTQVWSDEFEGPAGARVDESKWSYDLTDGCSRGNCGYGNNEKEYYSDSPSNISLNGQGQLMIVARIAQADLHCYYGRCLYTSGKITTRGKVLAQPGRVEARIRLPAGQGLWPAFWMLGQGVPGAQWPASGELDIMENKGSEPNISSSAIHGPGYSGNTPFAHRQRVKSPLTDYHVFAIEWDTRAARFFVDDILHYTVTRDAIQKKGKSILDQPFFMVLNLAVGGHFDGDPKSDAIFPATMLVDYVRVYRRPSN